MNEYERLKANIYKIYMLRFFSMFLVIMPIIVPYFETLHLGMFDIYLLQSIFAVGVVIFEVPSGYFSDLLGRKNTLIVGGFLYGIAYVIFVLSDSFWGFALFELSAALASSFISGTDIALIYDSIYAMKHNRLSTNLVIGKKLFYSQIGETLAALTGGIAAAYSLKLPILINAVTAWVPFLVALTLFEPPRKLMDNRKHKENFHYIYNSLFKHSRLLTLIILNLIFYSAVTLFAVWTYQKYWMENQIPEFWFGYLWAGYNLMVALTARFAHTIERYLSSLFVILLIGILPVAGFWGMAFATGYLGVVLGLCFQFTRGLTGVVLNDAINRRITGDLRATANSITALGMRLVFAIGGPILGWSMDTYGYKISFLTMGGVYVLIFMTVLLPFIAMRKSFSPPAGKV